MAEKMQKELWWEKWVSDGESQPSTHRMMSVYILFEACVTSPVQYNIAWPERRAAGDCTSNKIQAKSLSDPAHMQHWTELWQHSYNGFLTTVLCEHVKVLAMQHVGATTHAQQIRLWFCLHKAWKDLGRSWVLHQKLNFLCQSWKNYMVILVQNALLKLCAAPAVCCSQSQKNHVLPQGKMCSSSCVLLSICALLQLWSTRKI